MNAEILSQLVITGVHSVSTFYTAQNKGAVRINRPGWAIVIKYEGETVYTVNGKRFVSDISRAVVLPRGSNYEWEGTKAGHFSIIEFESESTHKEPMFFPVRHGERIHKLFRELEQKRTLRSPMYEAESIRDTYSILLSLAKPTIEAYAPSAKRQRIAPALEFISRNYSKNITNDTLAALVGTSTVYFRKLFCEVMGISPIAFVKQLRIEKAKEMLRSDYGSLGDIARSLGYSSLYDFSRDFKKQVGIAPSKYEE